MDSHTAFDSVNDQDQHSEPPLEKYDWYEAQMFETEETAPSHEFCFDLSDIDLPKEQQNCPIIGDLYRFIDTGLVPAGNNLTQANIANQDQYDIIDGILINFFQPRVKHNKNTLETCKNPRPTSGWIELTKSCTTSTMNFHMAYFSRIPQNNAKFKLSNMTHM